jgi:hypothetical protein
LLAATAKLVANRSQRFVQNPVLASADETLAAYPQKFFYCQNSRLGVHAARFWTTRSRNHNAESALRMKNTN